MLHLVHSPHPYKYQREKLISSRLPSHHLIPISTVTPGITLFVTWGYWKSVSMPGLSRKSKHKSNLFGWPSPLTSTSPLSWNQASLMEAPLQEWLQALPWTFNIRSGESSTLHHRTMLLNYIMLRQSLHRFLLAMMMRNMGLLLLLLWTWCQIIDNKCLAMIIWGGIQPGSLSMAPNFLKSILLGDHLLIMDKVNGQMHSELRLVLSLRRQLSTHRQYIIRLHRSARTTCHTCRIRCSSQCILCRYSNRWLRFLRAFTTTLPLTPVLDHPLWARVCGRTLLPVHMTQLDWSGDGILVLHISMNPHNRWSAPDELSKLSTCVHIPCGWDDNLAAFAMWIGESRHYPPNRWLTSCTDRWSKSDYKLVRDDGASHDRPLRSVCHSALRQSYGYRRQITTIHPGDPTSVEKRCRYALQYRTMQ